MVTHQLVEHFAKYSSGIRHYDQVSASENSGIKSLWTSLRCHSLGILSASSTQLEPLSLEFVLVIFFIYTVDKCLIKTVLLLIKGVLLGLDHSEGESLCGGEKKRLGRNNSPQNGRFGGRATSCEGSEEQTIDQARILGGPDNSLVGPGRRGIS